MTRLYLDPWLWAVPTAALSWLLISGLDPFRDRRVAVGFVAVLLLAIVIQLWRRLDRARSTLLSGRFTVFLLAFCVLFAFLAGTDVLEWKKPELLGYEQKVPRNWLGLDRLGDWRYKLLPSTSSESRLLVVTLAPIGERSAIDLRHELASIITQAATHGAKGVALDFFLERSGAEIDQMLCRKLEKARAAGMPVFVGYSQAVVDSRAVRRSLAPELEVCIPETDLGYLAGYAELDGRIRSVPLFFAGDDKKPALSLLIARELADEIKLPPDRLVRFTLPHGGLRTFDPPPEEPERYRDKFVMVGTSSPNDAHHTPFGQLQGVQIHAAAAYSLATGQFIHRLPEIWQFPWIFVFAFLMIAFQAQVGGWKTPLLLAALFSVVVVLAAAVAIRSGRVWIDVAYTIVAVWLLAGLLLAWGKVLRVARAQPVALASAAEGFDVMLCHNGADKSAVRTLADALVARGLRPWLDEDELVPGRPWQEGLETALSSVRSAAILVGGDGLGPWETQEMQVCLMQATQRKMPVIPVLLPGAPQKPQLPLFLLLYTWVDLRKGLAAAGLDRLVWGITGKKPTPTPALA